MELLPGSSPRFTQLLTDFSGADTVSILQPIVLYSTIIKNNSSSTITSITVRWTSTDYNRFVTSNTGQFEIVGTGVRPGEMVLMSPLSGLSLYMGPGETSPRLQNTDRLIQAITSLVQSYSDKSDVSISLDSVIFQDNGMIGPDIAGKLDEINRERRISKQLAKELLHRNASERSAYLTAVSDDLNVRQSLPPEFQGQRKRAVDMFKGIIAATVGYENFFNSAMLDIINKQTEEIYRRNR